MKLRASGFGPRASAGCYYWVEEAEMDGWMERWSESDITLLLCAGASGQSTHLHEMLGTVMHVEYVLYNLQGINGEGHQERKCNAEIRHTCAYIYIYTLRVYILHIHNWCHSNWPFSSPRKTGLAAQRGYICTYVEYIQCERRAIGAKEAQISQSISGSAAEYTYSSYAYSTLSTLHNST